MTVTEDQDWSQDYLNPHKRSIPNAIQVFFKNGSSTERVAIEYPIGHQRRRSEGIPLLEEKFITALQGHYPIQQAQAIIDICSNQATLEATAVDDFMALLSYNALL